MRPPALISWLVVVLAMGACTKQGATEPAPAQPSDGPAAVAPAPALDFGALLPGPWRFVTPPYGSSMCVLSGAMKVADDGSLSCRISAAERCGDSIVTAEESCTFSANGSKLLVTTRVISSNSDSGYQPDNFELEYDGAGFKGKMTSVEDAPVTFTRGTQ
jgi:hypothetical protein